MEKIWKLMKALLVRVNDTSSGACKPKKQPAKEIETKLISPHKQRFITSSTIIQYVENWGKNNLQKVV